MASGVNVDLELLQVASTGGSSNTEGNCIFLKSKNETASYTNLDKENNGDLNPSPYIQGSVTPGENSIQNFSNIDEKTTPLHTNEYHMSSAILEVEGSRESNVPLPIQDAASTSVQSIAKSMHLESNEESTSSSVPQKRFSAEPNSSPPISNVIIPKETLIEEFSNIDEESALLQKNERSMSSTVHEVKSARGSNVSLPIQDPTSSSLQSTAQGVVLTILEPARDDKPVSYTHLTLPTILLV